MATCPECGARSRDQPDALSIERVFVAKPPGTFSLAGVTLKASAYKAHKLVCRCGWYVYGQLTPEAFIAQICCPNCGRWSAHEDDIRNGYCGACHEFTSGPYGHPKETP